MVPAEIILDRLWPDKPPSGGLKTVRFHVSKLRGTLEPGVRGGGFKVVETRDAGYVIDPARHDIDFLRFDRLATEGHREIATRPDRAVELDAMRRSRELHGYITDVTEIDAEGWYGNPEWATEETAADFASTVGAEIAKDAQRIFELRS